MRRRDWAVQALVRDQKGAAAQWLSDQGCTLVAGDVTRPQGLARAMAGGDAVVHAAGVYELGVNANDRERMQQVNVDGTNIVLSAALEARIGRAIYVSTVWALGPSGYPPDPAVPKDESQRHAGSYLTPYERSKADAHQATLAWRGKGLPLIIAMPNAVVGANDRSLVIFCACICSVPCHRSRGAAMRCCQWFTSRHSPKAYVWQRRMRLLEKTISFAANHYQFEACLRYGDGIPGGWCQDCGCREARCTGKWPCSNPCRRCAACR